MRSRARNASGGQFSQTLKAGLAVGGGLSFGNLIGKFAKETAEAEWVGLRLSAVMKSTGNAAGFTRGELGRLATQLGDLASVDDDNVTAARTT